MPTSKTQFCQQIEHSNWRLCDSLLQWKNKSEWWIGPAQTSGRSFLHLFLPWFKSLLAIATSHSHSLSKHKFVKALSQKSSELQPSQSDVPMNMQKCDLLLLKLCRNWTCDLSTVIWMSLCQMNSSVHRSPAAKELWLKWTGVASFFCMCYNFVTKIDKLSLKCCCAICFAADGVLFSVFYAHFSFLFQQFWHSTKVFLQTQLSPQMKEQLFVLRLHNMLSKLEDWKPVVSFLNVSCCLRLSFWVSKSMHVHLWTTLSLINLHVD